MNLEQILQVNWLWKFDPTSVYPGYDNLAESNADPPMVKRNSYRRFLDVMNGILPPNKPKTPTYWIKRQ